MNYPHSTRKLALAVAIASSLAIAGCDTSNEKVAAPPPALSNPAYSFQAGVAPFFNPVTKQLPLNTDIVFAAAVSSDGTAQSGTDSNAVFSALNDLDGFSTTAYFDIAFDDSLDPASISTSGPTQNVFLLALNTNGDALDPENIDQVNPFDLANIPAIEVEVVSLDDGTDNVVRIKPTEPLLPATKYLAFLTNGVKDASGAATTVGQTYNIIRTPDTPISESLIPVRAAIYGWETLSANFLSVASGGAVDVPAAKSALTLAFTFTTTDPNKPLLAMAAPRAAIVKLQTDKGLDAPTAIGNATNLDSAGFLSTPKARGFGISAMTKTDVSGLTGGAVTAGVANLFTGYITLPYYLPAASKQAPFDPTYLADNWRPDLALAGQLGATVPSDVDSSYNVTYRYPFAEKKGDESVPLQVTLPNPTVVPTAFGGGATCAQIQGAQSNPGYPVVIYVHGITSDRTSVVALAHTLASQCIATVAIDLPVHGIAASSPYKDGLNIERATFAALYTAAEPRERHFNVAQDAAGQPAPMDFTASTGDSGAWFINLGRLQNTRDNLRQSVMDFLNLNATLGAIAEADLDGDADTDTPLFDLSKVYVVGVSLGGSVGTVFTSINQQAIAADTAVSLTSNLNSIQGFVASAPAGQLAQVILNSVTLGPTVKNGLAANGVLEGTSDFEKFAY